MGQRRQARELALQFLFQNEFNKETKPVLGDFQKDVFSNLEVRLYAQILVQGVYDKINEINTQIQNHSTNWKITRINMVDLSLLRIAIYEMFFASELLTPQIAINEAIEMAKKYGTNESSSFINGVLDNCITHPKK